MGAVLHVRAFDDNYIWLIPGKNRRDIAIVDPGDADPVFSFLQNHPEYTPVAIFCTHHHGDHSGGIQDLQTKYEIPAYGPATERIEGVTDPVMEGDIVQVGELAPYRVLDIPGHTRGHVAYYGEGNLFCGDTLFSAGCGRLFEGTPEQMYASLAKLAALPLETAVYCAHEYTVANLRFARAIEPENPDIPRYEAAAKKRAGQGLPTLPSTIGLEKRINPFLRTTEPAVISAVTTAGEQKSDTGPAVFARLRRQKDVFAG